MSAAMTWEILRALILGFALSAVVRAVVRRNDIACALGANGRGGNTRVMTGPTIAYLKTLK